MKRLSAILIVALMLASCSLFQSKSDILVKIGKDVLYKQDVYKLIPEGSSAHDSAIMVDQYVQSWALPRLKTLKAQEQLTLEERDITKEIEDFRNNLISFRYEKMYMESRIDTIVSRDQMEDYYNNHQQSFIYDYSVVKARLITIGSRSPYYSNIKELYQTTNPDELSQLHDLCQSYAEKYEDYSQSWVSMLQVARDLGMMMSELEDMLSQNKSFIIEGEQKNILVFFYEIYPPNTLTPFDYNEKKIQEAIISKRKQEILAKLEQDLLNEALENNKMKRYD
ncbi:MAG: hypothetical protein GX664_06535 [Bacteroidales bacterium]|nr:hypothetical protein [Bacteroidales bacterium]